MATIASFTIPANQFPLGTIFEDFPDVKVDLERVIPTNSGLIPYVWVSGIGEGEIEHVIASFDDRPDVQDITLIDSAEGDYLYRVEWGQDYAGILAAIVETDVVLISGVGTADEWAFELRADDREDVAAFERYCRDHHLPITLTSIRSLGHQEQSWTYDLTETQREALVLAYERGYYEVPSETTLSEMATELGITGQSMGSRLNRGVHRLIGSTLGSQNPSP
jgi:predicted DNA binding protein